jgi:protein-S-isoprenylcysteine O-methyltransferase Ste14
MVAGAGFLRLLKVRFMSARRFLVRIPPVVVLLLCLLLGMIAGRYWMAPVPAQWVALVASLVLFFLGGSLILRAGLVFRRHRTTIWPLGRPTQLLRSGPFRFSRNPVYLGMLLLAGLPFSWTGQPEALLSPLLFFWYLNAITIPFEEARLQETFPDDYPQYARQVRRWL